MLGRWHELPDIVPWQCLLGTFTRAKMPFSLLWIG